METFLLFNLNNSRRGSWFDFTSEKQDLKRIHPGSRFRGTWQGESWNLLNDSRLTFEVGLMDKKAWRRAFFHICLHMAIGMPVWKLLMLLRKLQLGSYASSRKLSLSSVFVPAHGKKNFSFPPFQPYSYFMASLIVTNEAFPGKEWLTCSAVIDRASKTTSLLLISLNLPRFPSLSYTLVTEWGLIFETNGSPRESNYRFVSLFPFISPVLLKFILSSPQLLQSWSFPTLKKWLSYNNVFSP